MLTILSIQRVGSNTCNSYWYWNYWGYYWGGWWYYPEPLLDPWDIGYSGCAQWRTVLAFSFISGFLFLLSFILVSAPISLSMLPITS